MFRGSVESLHCLSQNANPGKAQNRRAQFQFQLEIEKLETEVDKAGGLCQLELESQKEAHVPSASTDATGMSSSFTTLPRSGFDILKHIALGHIF